MTERMRLNRPNLVHAVGERWQPPAFSTPTTRWAWAAAAVRRFLDLQAGSIWRDLAQLLPHCGGTIVDVGCGAQPYRPLLLDSVSYVGIDTVEAMENFGYEVPGTVYYSGDVWPVSDGAADIVLCTETLEHVPDTARFLTELHRCLRPGGWAVLTVPFAARWHYIPHDYWRFTPSSLARLLTEAGLADIAVYARGNAGTVACYKAMAIMLPLLAPQGRGPTTAFALRCVGIALSPLFVALAVVANLTLRGRGGDDCLGYTVVAVKPA